MSEKLNKWLELLKAAEKTCIISDGKKNIKMHQNSFLIIKGFSSIGRRKIHYTFPDKTEMAEEYALQSGEILSNLMPSMLKFN